ncbi:BspA family leucine-rich repeat surface protein [Mycoplasma feriruminatoris]|uniref:BspA family leucine-rich repeat surface protein n=1 Tax=Mycoplasma feriruminatoris TaxID=1179777 RepID=A0ABY8HWB8_9MOLU|nr:BspA family leucine-rich repeat surface protein [Mycoplasma feriruminatoris]WFQ93286.1 BspA family leucine-rich repeat surface protein [Mycoplasma feriruminatoris]
MKHLLKIISSLTILSTGVLAVSCTRRIDNKDIKNNISRENKDKNKDSENISQDDPNVLPKIEITEEEKKAAIDTLKKVFKQQEDAFGTFHTYQDVVNQLKVYLGDFNVKHLEYLKLTNESEKDTQLKVDSGNQKANKIDVTYFDKQDTLIPKTVLENKVQAKYNNNNNELIQIGYEQDKTIKSIKLTKVNKETIKVPKHLPLKITSLDESFKELKSSMVDNLDKWDIKNIKYLTKTFNDAKEFNQNLTSWDVSNVLDMTEMFAGATKFNQDLNSWDTSKVEDMVGLFWEAEEFNGNISNWNVKNVENMSSMFSGAKKFNQNLDKWDTSNVLSMEGMFSHTDVFNGKISNWDTSKVATMKQMFEGAKAFNQSLESWNVSNVGRAEDFRKGAEKNIIDEYLPKFKEEILKILKINRK